jgi:hypothetical protein
VIVCLVRRRSIGLFPNDETRYPPTGEIIEFRMPPAASTWDEFVRMVDRECTHGAVC